MIRGWKVDIFMVKLNKKKLIANILLSSMVLAQTVPTFANVLEDIDPIKQTFVEEETIDEEIETFDDEVSNDETTSSELDLLTDDNNDDSDVVMVTEETDQESLEAPELLLEEQLPLVEELEETGESVVESFFSGEGDGSVTSPFQITTEAELNEMREDLTAHYRLMNDITLTSEWLPIGYGTTLATKFTGSFTAEPGTVIRNMVVTSGEQAGDLGNRGFFGVVDGATISGITLENPRVVGGLYGNNIGGLVGRVTIQKSIPTTITDSAVVGGSIEASGSYVGGLIGYMADYMQGTIVARSSSSATITVKANPNMYPQAVGGLIGVNAIEVVDSYATGDVTANTTNTGGLIGLNSFGIVSRSYATGNIDSPENMNVGGLIGGHDYYSTVEDSYATGDVIGGLNVGGFIGAIHPDAFGVARNYSTGHVSGVDYVGGFVGNAGSMVIKNSYAMGDVTGESNVDHFGLGGTNSNNYYYNNSEALYNGVPVGGQVIEDVIEPLDVIELRTQATYESSSWDFGSTWVWDSATNYPKLGLGNEIDTLPIDALGETLQVSYSGAETRIPLTDAFSLFGRGGNPDDYLFETNADGVSISDDGMDLILEISSVGIYEVTATPISRITVLEPGQNWNKAIIEVTPAEIVLEKGTVFSRTFNGTTEIDHFDMPTLAGLAPEDEVIWQEASFQYTNSAAGTNTIEGANWTLDWGTVNLSNYDVTGLPTLENGEYLVTDVFDVEAITKANGAFLRIDEELAKQNNTHEVITIAGTALLHHDDTPDTPGEHWYHDHADELLQDITFLIYDTDPQATPLARVVAYADGVAAVDGVFVGLSANTTYWITAISDESDNFLAGEESDPIMLSTTSLSGGGEEPGGENEPGGAGAGGEDGTSESDGTDRTGGTGSTGNNVNNGTLPSGTNLASNRGNNQSVRGGNLPKAGSTVGPWMLVGSAAIAVAVANWVKQAKKE
ncbi:hypothetical protein C6P52_00005 [Enterococcus mundtii]|nr:hypothetical protein C6P52_00005 [Enterococcus mundtii]PTO43603.1 hypothetical protein C6P54_09160 [Enterococcus mundtii]